MSAIAYHYDGSSCSESCSCASREVEHLREHQIADMVDAVLTHGKVPRG